MSRSDQAHIGPPCARKRQRRAPPSCSTTSSPRSLARLPDVRELENRLMLLLRGGHQRRFACAIGHSSRVAAHRSQPRGKAGLRERGPQRMRARGNERVGQPHGVQENQRNPGRRVHALRQTRFGDCDSPLARRARLLLHGRPRGRPRGCSAALPAHQRGLLASIQRRFTGRPSNPQAIEKPIEQPIENPSNNPSNNPSKPMETGSSNGAKGVV